MAFNLINDKWLPVIRENGPDTIALCQITDSNNKVIDLNFPRPDLQANAYVLLIAVFQTAMAPEDHEAWLELYENSPTPDHVKAKLETIAPYFNLDDATGPCFLQDLTHDDLKKSVSINSLLLDYPGINTVKFNTDFFIKRNTVNNVCLPCAGIMLYTQQQNAPAGGKGHRTCMRGVGPLTTLVSSGRSTTLYKKTWLNVLDLESLNLDKCETDYRKVLPWLVSTVTSEKKDPKDKNSHVQVSPEDVNFLQSFWGMPRRIKLNAIDTEEIGCDICGNKTTRIVRDFNTKIYGIAYSDTWLHLLTPYIYSSGQKAKIPFPCKANLWQSNYNHYLGIAYKDSVTGCSSAKVVQTYTETRANDLPENFSVQLWCFGFYLDKANNLGWCDQKMPLLTSVSAEQREYIILWLTDLNRAATEAARILKAKLYEATRRSSKETLREFWQHTEYDFYRLLEELSVLSSKQQQFPADVYNEWNSIIVEKAISIFDSKVNIYVNSYANVNKVIKARKSMLKELQKNKFLKKLKI